jgi:hypothetical protein
MSNELQPHGIFTDYTQGCPFDAKAAQIAYVKPADPEVAAEVLSRTTEGMDGRSPFVWLRLHDGTLMLGVFPRGDTYMEMSDNGVCDWEDDKPDTPAVDGDFEGPADIRVEGPNFAVTLEYIGEGNDGDYDPSDPADQPLFRFCTQQRVDGEWEDVDSGSYCTQVPANISPDDAQKVADYLLNRLEVNGDSGLKRFCEGLSWTSLDTVLADAARRSEELANLIASHGITEFAPANSRFIPEAANEGRYVGISASGFTAFTFSKRDVEASGLPVAADQPSVAA